MLLVRSQVAAHMIRNLEHSNPVDAGQVDHTGD